VHGGVAVGTPAVWVGLEAQQELYERVVQFLNGVEQRAVAFVVQDVHVAGREVVVETQQLVQFTSLDTVEQF
jgi:hypothetical protein